MFSLVVPFSQSEGINKLHKLITWVSIKCQGVDNKNTMFHANSRSCHTRDAVTSAVFETRQKDVGSIPGFSPTSSPRRFSLALGGRQRQLLLFSFCLLPQVLEQSGQNRG